LAAAGTRICRVSRGNTVFPNEDLLIEIALLEERLDDAIALYDDRKHVGRWDHGMGEILARAVADTHPDAALRIWRSIAEALIDRVKPKAYREAAVHLRKMRRIFEKSGQMNDWTALIKQLRVQHKAKRRLMEVLDELEKNDPVGERFAEPMAKRQNPSDLLFQSAGLKPWTLSPSLSGATHFIRHPCEGRDPGVLKVSGFRLKPCRNDDR